MSPSRIAVGDGHVFIHVGDLPQARAFYRDLLGIPVKRTTSDWIDLAPTLGLSLSKGDEESLEFHVDNFEETAARLEKAGVEVKRKSKHGGSVTDPFGNTIGIHDHRK